VAVAQVDALGFTYPAAGRSALAGVSLELEAGEVVALLGASGSGKTTLLRALAGLVPHFHGGRFEGRVAVAGLDTRRTRPADLAGTVATVFQDPEDQVVMSLVANEVAFGLENVGTPPAEIEGRVEAALAAVATVHLAGRRTTELSGGELQRVCLASALALGPQLLLLDEPTSQLDPEAAETFLDTVAGLGVAVVLSEQRIERALALADRVVFLEEGRVVLDAPREEALGWLAACRPAYVARPGSETWPEEPWPEARRRDVADPVVTASAVSFSYGAVPVLDRVDLDVGRGEVVVLEGPNGSGKTTLAKVISGLLEPGSGVVERGGRVCYLSQDPGRYLVRERVDAEVALAVGGDLARARRALAGVDLEWAAGRHPRDLSSGERERLGLAAVTVAEPDLLVLDEPTRGVDPERKAALARWLFEYAGRGRGVLVVTHDRSFPAHRRVALRVEEKALV
jgi:energy-coupling factor transport system ATP-binding protein